MSVVFVYKLFFSSHVMFKDDSDAMHVQPSLPEVSVHGEDGLPVGSKLGLRGVFGSAVLQRQDLEKRRESSVEKPEANRGRQTEIDFVVFLIIIRLWWRQTTCWISVFISESQKRWGRGQWSRLVDELFISRLCCFHAAVWAGCQHALTLIWVDAFTTKEP